MEKGDRWVSQPLPCWSGAPGKYPVIRNLLIWGQWSLLTFQEVTSNGLSLLKVQAGLFNSTDCSPPKRKTNCFSLDCFDVPSQRDVRKEDGWFLLVSSTIIIFLARSPGSAPYKMDRRWLQGPTSCPNSQMIARVRWCTGVQSGWSLPMVLLTERCQNRG